MHVKRYILIEMREWEIDRRRERGGGENGRKREIDRHLGTCSYIER
jgi:hypothetical protein